jgi:DNA polymerase
VPPGNGTAIAVPPFRKERSARVSEETVPHIRSLKALRAAEAACARCPLYRNATQVVPGEGPARSRLMMVGEQPGDQEDRKGHPFVGPAGGILEKALDAAGIDRDEVFVTNAVKHFKFEPRGKRRLHKRPNAYEIDRCHLWLAVERNVIKPVLIVALGATAVRSLAGKPIAINRIRGKLTPLADGGRMLATIHPSAILRAPEDEARHAMFKSFVADLKTCARALAKAA